MLIQTLISKLSIQALTKSVQSGLAWLNKTELYFRFFAPEEHRLASKFCAIITSDGCWETSADSNIHF